MLDANGVLWLIVSGACVGFFSKLLSNIIGKIIAVVFAFPMIMFILGTTYSGLQIHGISNLSPWIITTVNGLVPLALSGAGEGTIGIPFAIWLKRVFS